MNVARGAPKAPGRRGANGAQAPPDRKGHTRVGAKDGAHEPAALVTEQAQELTDEERALLGDLLAVIAEHSLDAAREVDPEAVERAFTFACERHGDQRRRT
ncbi:MAG: hypothetical protein ACRDMH_11230, partial [Solirubrobacterales bacterium]